MTDINANKTLFAAPFNAGPNMLSIAMLEINYYFKSMKDHSEDSNKLPRRVQRSRLYLVSITKFRITVQSLSRLFTHAGISCQELEHALTAACQIWESSLVFGQIGVNIIFIC